MFFHTRKLQHPSKPEKPDAVHARKLQEVTGGQYGEHMSEGSWAQDKSPDGLSKFTYVETPPEGVPMNPPTHPDARCSGTTELSNTVEKVAGEVREKLNRE